ncbi:CAP domain-containing protein [Aspergillus avenaceus]|uniref:CAP domain-containing protein n=1 Tax=Aspergillus avenaceus TaxID=36643 RepID=A0A5N6U1Y1_ASPAV|nr:CAP domain-containing protein [Aspergillus avenaceus]
MPQLPKTIYLYLSLLLATLITAQQTIHSTVIVTMTPTSPKPPSYTSTNVFKDTVLATSNTYRKEHNASNLVWNETLTKYAKNWAEGCKWEHSHGPYGENLAFGYANASAAVAAWGDERTMYDFDKPTGFTEETGHFTQLVWRATTDVGCAAIDCGYESDSDNKKRGTGSYTRAQGWYVVCEYSPAGNVLGSSRTPGGEKGLFKVNVQPASTYSGPSPTTTSGPSASQTKEGGAQGLVADCRMVWVWIGIMVLIMI